MKWLIDVVNLEEYYKMADELVDKIVKKEIDRFYENYKNTNSLPNKDSIGLSLLRISTVVSIAIQKRMMARIVEADKKYMKHVMDEDDSNRLS